MPADHEAYATTDAIRVAVDEVTRENTEQATREWRRHTQTLNPLTKLSAQPVVELRPSGSLEVVIRYITRAQDRFDMRSRLYQKLLGILHAPPQFTSPEALAPPAEEAVAAE